MSKFQFGCLPLLLLAGLLAVSVANWRDWWVVSTTRVLELSCSGSLNAKHRCDIVYGTGDILDVSVNPRTQTVMLSVVTESQGGRSGISIWENCHVMDKANWRCTNQVASGKKQEYSDSSKPLNAYNTIGEFDGQFYEEFRSCCSLYDIDDEHSGISGIFYYMITFGVIDAKQAETALNKL